METEEQIVVAEPGDGAKKILELLLKRLEGISFGPRAKVVILVSCDEPDLGGDVGSFSLARMNCSPCEAAYMCDHAIEEHDKKFHSQEELVNQCRVEGVQ